MAKRYDLVQRITTEEKGETCYNMLYDVMLTSP